MKLFLNDTSPFARLVLATAIEHGCHDLELEWVDPWADNLALLTVTPFSIIPVLEAGEGNLIYESLLICRHLAGADAFPDDQAILARFGFAKTLMETAFRKAIFNRFLDAADNTLTLRAESAIVRALQRLGGHPELPIPERCPTLADLAMGVALDYTRFRLPSLYHENASADTRTWLDRFAQREAMRLTQPEKLAHRPASLQVLLAGTNV